MDAPEQRRFGDTGLTVSAIGLGAGQIGEPDVTEAEAREVLCTALDLGVTLIDTAHGYKASEERIGRHLAARREEFILSTKGGAGVDGHEDWTPGALRASIDLSLRRTRSERIDVFHLHSCPTGVLQRGDLQDTLDAAVAAGKVGVAAYSGDNSHLVVAADSGRFGSIETSVNIADQWNLRNVVGRRPELGVIAKRPIANAAWRFADRPVGDYAERYWERLRALGYERGELGWTELALRFTAFAPGVHTAIVGTAKVENLRGNLALADRGPLPAEVLSRLDETWRRVGADWPAST
ncbi:MAG: aldo/keto reductase [Acidobacteria bacterium]|nr:aldo/keto reductase [Acidobacteriota bacterium]